MWDVIGNIHEINQRRIMKLRIITEYPHYNGCIPFTAYIVQRWEDTFWGGKWVSIKGFQDRAKAEELMRYLR